MDRTMNVILSQSHLVSTDNNLIRRLNQPTLSSRVNMPMVILLRNNTDMYY